jgi:glycosyltransferase involved in cell wall biosynthesis
VRILYLITRSDLGGAQVHLLDLLGRLPATIRPVVGVGQDGYFADAIRNLGIRCRVVPQLVQPIAPSSDVRALFALVNLVREVKPDLVHAHTSKAGILGRLAARIAGVPCVFTAHTWCFMEGTSWKWKVAGVPAERLAASCCSAIINVSEANRNLALRYRISKAQHQLVIHNGIADTPHRARPDLCSIPTAVPTVVMVARFCAQKDQGLLLRALSEARTPARVVFVGDGPTRPAIEEEAVCLGLRDRVEFLGERQDVPEILAAAHVFALPTNWEGFPLSILEAMRAGLPVIASDVGGVAEGVVEGTTGFLVPRGDAAAFRDRLDRLLHRPSVRQQMGAAGRRRYEAKFTLDAMTRNTLAVYHSVLHGVHAPAAASRAVTAQSRGIPVDL